MTGHASFGWSGRVLNRPGRIAAKYNALKSGQKAGQNILFPVHCSFAATIPCEVKGVSLKAKLLNDNQANYNRSIWRIAINHETFAPEDRPAIISKMFASFNKNVWFFSTGLYESGISQQFRSAAGNLFQC